MTTAASAAQPLIDAGYEIVFLSHAAAILSVDFPTCWPS
jgi:hypothetical protein